MKTKIKFAAKLPLLNLISFSLVLIIGVAYIAQVNQNSTRGYQMKALEDRIDTLQVQNEQIEYRIAENQSVGSVNTKLQMLGLVPVEQVAYVSSGTASVAVNR